MFHWDKNRKRTGDGSQDAPDTRQLRAENAQEHTTGLGISLNDYMDQLEADMAPLIAQDVSVSTCASFELVTSRINEGQTFDPADEVEQHLTIERSGQVHLRTNTWHHGVGRLGIGRILDTTTSPAAVREICRMLDAWLYTIEQSTWDSTQNPIRWYLRVRFDDGREQIRRGRSDGAWLEGMDISQFIRERIPLEQLYLFDENL